MRIEMRLATDDDISFLISLRRETMELYLLASGASVSDRCHRDRVLHHFDCAKIIVNDGERVGLLKVKRYATAWEIIQIQLSSHVQGKGIGRSLLEGVIADATAAGVAVKLTVLKANPARHLYERLGFIIVSEDAHEHYMHHAVSNIAQLVDGTAMSRGVPDHARCACSESVTD